MRISSLIIASYISSVANNSNKIDTIFVTTLNGYLVEIALP